MRSAESSDPQACSEHLIEMFLLDAIILAFSRDAQAKQVAIKSKAALGVRDHDGGVVNADEKLL